jgi:hypothetical protein
MHLSTEEIIRLVFSFLGGGLVSAITQWVRSARSERKERRIKYLTGQIQNLYGPLFFLTSQNESYFKLNRAFHGAYGTEYIGQNWSKDSITQERVKEAASQTLSLANTYVDLVVTNNDKILALLQQNYSYIDTDDVEVCQSLVVDYTRMKTEMDDDGKLVTPMRIYGHIGEISFMRPEFMERVKTKFFAKKDEIEAHSK